MNRLAVGIAALLIVSTAALAREAKGFSVKKQTPVEIVSDRDHFNIVFVGGWLSKKDSLIDKIFSKDTKIAASTKAEGKYWDGDTLSDEWVVENTDVGHNLDRPWQVSNKLLLANAPADTAIATIEIKVANHKEDRIKQMIDAFQKNEPTQGLDVEPYMTYAKLVDGFFGAIFGTDATKYPFLITTGLADPFVQSSKGMYEHYIVAIAPNSEPDPWLRSLDGTKLSYEEGKKQLSYDGGAVTDHTYAILWVGKGPGVSVQQLMLSSKAPWAVVALTNFYQAGLPDLGNASDVPRYDKNMVQQLGSCLELLKRELRFSAYDRAVGLHAFAEQAKKVILSACTVKNIAADQCKTPQIDTFEGGIDDAVGVKNADTKKEVPKGASSLNLELRQSLNLK